EIARHRRFSDADWAMDEQVLTRLEAIAAVLKPSATAERNAYLFDWHPDIPGVDVLDHQRYDAKLRDLRDQAVRDAIAESSIDGLRTLALRSPAPGHLGWHIAKVAPEQLTPSLLVWLDADEDALRLTASQWANISLSRQ